MIKKILSMLALAGVVWFTVICWHRDSVPAPIDNAGETTEAVTQPRFPAVLEAVQSWATADELQARLTKEIRDQLNSGNEISRETVLTNLLPQLVALNPAAAGRLAEAIEPDAGRNDVLRVVAQDWADKDPAGALAWAAQLSDPDEQRITLANTVFQMAQSDPARAVEVVRQNNLNDGPYDLLPSLAVQWADKDLPAALAWAGKQPPGAQRDEIMSRIAFVESQNAPAEAGARVLVEIPPGAVQEEAVMTVIHQWSLQDMAGVLAWVRLFPDIPLRERAFAELAVVHGGHNSYDPASSASSPNTP